MAMRQVAMAVLVAAVARNIETLLLMPFIVMALLAKEIEVGLETVIALGEVAVRERKVLRHLMDRLAPVLMVAQGSHLQFLEL